MGECAGACRWKWAEERGPRLSNGGYRRMVREGTRQGEGEDEGSEPGNQGVESREVEVRRRRHGTEDLISGRMRNVGGGGEGGD